MKKIRRLVDVMRSMDFYQPSENGNRVYLDGKVSLQRFAHGDFIFIGRVKGGTV